MSPRRVFFVTGTSSGLGRMLVDEILARGDAVAATSRDASQLASKFAGSITADTFLPLTMDVSDMASVDAAFDAAIATFGRIDVVVNNAGFGLCGPFEELSDAQVRAQIEINFFGCVNVTRRAVRAMREQTPAGGLIQQISSMAGQKGMPTFSIYCASKWALAGFSEAVAQEVRPEWNITFTIVEPGGFR